MRILLTGAAGFIGSHLTEKLLAEGNEVVGIDNFDPFYPKKIKENNLKVALANPAFRFIQADLCDAAFWENLKNGEKFDLIVHLAAKAGVRPSMLDPVSYNETNVVGTTYVLEFARNNGVKKVVFASSSSVYGINSNLPWRVEDGDLKPISVYAFSKQSGERLCELYQRDFGIKIIALRFFTVFGPRQRPDLAINKFVKAIENDQEVTLYGDGKTFRDYTYVGDIVSGVVNACHYDNEEFEIFNLGNTHTVSLLELVQVIEGLMGKKARIKFLPPQQGDVPYTWSNIEKSQKLLSYSPKTGIKEGIQKFIEWYKNSQ
jgi:UDP-glucuronate 4-epimerase